MQSPIEYYFDFTSPFGYLGSRRIEAIAGKHNREVSWKPIVLGFIFKVTESKPIIEVPLKGDYARHDLDRSARELNIDFKLPDMFPINSIAAARAVLWAQANGTDTQSATNLIHALYEAYFTQGMDISQADVVVQVAEQAGINADALSSALQDDKVKTKLKDATAEAISNKVFGSPFMLVDNEPFWGSDRLDQLDRWLEQGGW